MYLSRLELNLRSRAVQRDLADCQELHRTLLKAFPNLPGGRVRQDSGLLYREDDGRNGIVKILVQSKLEPDWSFLKEGYLIRCEGPKQIDRSYEKLHDGQVLSFVLKANPTRKTGTSLKTEHTTGTKKNGTRKFITDINEQLQWIARKGKDGGFELVSVKVGVGVFDVDIRPETIVKGQKQIKNCSNNSPNTKELTFGSVLFSGHLKITDQNKFVETVCGGIGSGKAYGFGLLSLALPR